ncbi:hypothetical protein M3221_05375 [Domibacillus indicus]|uniref:hypothetical protein n=1 Tax=Domibacillus indicus TaxID=1437523 RepID=UPI00203EBFF3|nr:hypothetical protein [Domibacillus indicus]MCM3787850.1 hypothetical protein [Domibacillus indicus]
MGALSAKTKWILFVCLIMAIAVVIAVGAVRYADTKEVISRIAPDARRTAEAWSKGITKEEIKKVIQSKSRDGKAARKLEEHFNRLSRCEPQLTHGYIFGAELKNGTDTRFVAASTDLANAAEKNGLETGDFYTQPANIANVIEEMKKKKTTIISKPYSDDYGTWLTVVKPYLDENGEVFAYYGIDYDVKPYVDYQRKVLLVTGSILLVLLLAVIFLMM